MALEDAVTSKKRTGNPRPVRRIRISPGAVLLTGAAIIGAVYLISQAVKADTAPLQNTPEQPGQVQLYTTPTVEPTATVMPTATAIPGIENVMSEAEVKATLEEILAIDRPLTPDDAEYLKKAEQVNKSIYFMLTGKTFEQQKFGTRIVSRERYDAEVHPNLKGTVGTVKLEHGSTYIYASLPLYARDLIFTLAHETGQAYFIREGPLNIDVGITNPDFELGLRRGETLQALYRAAVLNKMRELGIKGMLPPQKAAPYATRVFPSDYFYNQAWAAAWILTLDDPEAGKNLSQTGWAGSDNLMRIYGYYALLDYKKNTLKENTAREAAFKAKLIAAIQNRVARAPEVEEIIQRRITNEGQRYIIGVTDTLP